MAFFTGKKWLMVAAVAFSVALGWRWVLPVALPFGLGALVALVAEPLSKGLRRWIPGPAATAVAVSAVLLAVLGLLMLLTALLVKQLTSVTGPVPRLIDSTRATLGSLQGMMEELSNRAPKTVQPLLRRTVEDVFSDGGALLDGFVGKLPEAATAVMGYVTDSALAVGTGCLSAYMISVRLPKLRQWLQTVPEDSLPGKILLRLRRVRGALWGWLKAQAKLTAICFGILLLGFWLLKLPRAPLWAVLIALVDAIPLLGTGTVLVPWAILCFLQGNTLRGAGLLVIYAAALLSRTALEPRLLGRHLGLDPLLTLVSLYAGYCFWGIGGMLISPILCVVVRESVE
jgi:sporulation integral membrane protein YtvI